MTGSALTISSPSSSRTIRRTPWVEGCCGPMLRIISSVRSSPSVTTSIPPPRSIHASLAAVNAARSCTSIKPERIRYPSWNGRPRPRPGPAAERLRGLAVLLDSLRRPPSRVLMGAPRLIRLGDRLQSLAHLARAGVLPRHVADRKDADQLVALHH